MDGTGEGMCIIPKRGELPMIYRPAPYITCSVGLRKRGLSYLFAEVEKSGETLASCTPDGQAHRDVPDQRKRWPRCTFLRTSKISIMAIAQSLMRSLYGFTAESNLASDIGGKSFATTDVGLLAEQILPSH